ncbi:MAG TPA: alpha/beta hydrolase [Gaiellaceae bacterium]|nr:alpha/beta hydrolase [Gaiellaceae bacterium]
MEERWFEFTGSGECLACRDFGGHGSPVLLLHGLAGHAGEWAETASWLTWRARVYALDQRGHGRSERRPGDVSRASHVADVIALVESVGSPGAILIGQSLGGQTALLTAARRPDLVKGLVVAEATAGEPTPEVSAEVRALLEAWPVPFPSRGAALDFFGGEGLAAHAWADGLEEGPDGLRPRFDIDVLVSILEAAETRSYWDEWASIRCPTLVVRGEHGTLRADEASRMTDSSNSRLVEIPGSGHDVHLEDPGAWRAAIEGFLDARPR